MRPLGVPRITLDHGRPIREAAFGPNNRLVITVGEKGTAKVWDAKTGSVLSSIGNDDAEGIEAATFSPDGRRVLTISRTGKANLHRI
ncbi:MAG: WD40 repeat domain-containing protein, partial [Pyrinomonadaceae bacterium]